MYNSIKFSLVDCGPTRPPPNEHRPQTRFSRLLCFWIFNDALPANTIFVAWTVITTGVDFATTQLVDGNWGVHATVPKALFADGARAECPSAAVSVGFGAAIGAIVLAASFLVFV